MISFCEDVTISYEYHIYENKTVKKITHKRNGSSYSQKTFNKTPKIELISKAQKAFSVKPKKGIAISDLKYNNSQNIKKSKQINNQTSLLKRYEPNQKNNFQMYQSSIISGKKKITPQIFTNYKIPKTKNKLSLQSNSHRQNRKNYNFFFEQGKQKQLSSPIYSYQDQIKQPNNALSTYRNISQQKNSDINLQTTNIIANEAKSCFYQTRANSLNTDFNQQMNYHSNEAFQQYSSLTKLDIEDINLKNSFNVIENPEVNDFDIRNYQNLIDFKESSIFPSLNENKSLNINFTKSRLYDAQSIESRNINDSNDNQSISVVQQRNYFLQKQPNSQHLFKNSLENYINLSKNDVFEKWMSFSKVQDKTNRNIYSIKQFTQANSKHYFNEYENYLILKKKKSESTHILNLFNSFSNNPIKTYCLIKEPYRYLLNEYLIKTTKQLTDNNRYQQLSIIKQTIENRILEIFEYLKSYQLDIDANQNLEFEDFVVNEFNVSEIKFHNLYKLKQSPKTLNSQKSEDNVKIQSGCENKNKVEISNKNLLFPSSQKPSDRKLKTQQTGDKFNLAFFKVQVLMLKMEKAFFNQ